MAVVRFATDANTTPLPSNGQPSAIDAAPANKGRKPGSGISRTTVNFWLDTWLLVNFLALVWISFLLRFIFPRGTAASGWTLWGYGYDDWANVQFATLAVLMLGILVHVMLHWTWVCGVITSRMHRPDGKPVRWDDGVRTLVGVGLIVVLLNIMGLLMALAALTIRTTP
jgi:hypothetical protein